MEFALPEAIRDLIEARNNLRDHYASSALSFTLDGNLIGDLGEAIAAEIFGINLIARNGIGIDGFAPDGRSVQVKASGTNRGPAFRWIETRADHLLFFLLDFDNCRGKVAFNGPEHIALSYLPKLWSGQRMLSLSQIRGAGERVPEDQRLLPLNKFVERLPDQGMREIPATQSIECA